MSKQELLELLDTMSHYHFCLEVLGWSKEETIQAMGLDFDPDKVDLTFTCAES